MATTYGYGGEFSSDEDVDKLEQQQTERMVQAKFDNSLRPNKKQIEDTIEAIKCMPMEQEINLSDEMLAGLLDYYKTQRGPIVDSTRKLYIKIAMRLVRGEHQSQIAGSDNVVPKDTNGNSNSNMNNNNNNNNNNSINLIHKAPQQKADTFSSDEDDDLPILNRRNVVNNDENKMDVDSVTPTGPVRVTKQVDMLTTDEEDEDEDEESSNEDTSDLEELNSESDVMDVTPIKPLANQPSGSENEKDGVETVLAAPKVTPRQLESSIKRQPLAQSTPKDPSDTAKKPYTRSQRVATRSATRSKASAESTAKSLTKSAADTDVFVGNRRTSSKKYAFLSMALLVVILASLLYYFRSSITSPAVRFLGPKVKF